MAEQFDLIISGATIVEPHGRDRSDLGITDGRIAARGNLTLCDAAERLDASGLLLLPGVIDTQVHFREPGLTHKEDLETGSKAAVLGGVTSVFEEPNTNPTTTTREALNAKLDSAAGRMWCHYAFWVGASMDNLDEISILDPLPGSPGIGEVFMGSSTGPLLVADDDSLRKVLRNASRRVSIHAEDEPRLLSRVEIRDSVAHARNHPVWRDVESSVLATRRVLALSEETGHPIHVLHVSTAEELPLLAEGKSQIGTSCEVTPQHLTFTDDDYEELGSRIQMNTPIRESRHRDALWAAVLDGLFDVIGSDHAPHTLEEKSAPYPKSPSGMPGVQTLLPVMLDHAASGRISIEQIVRMTSTRPAELFGCHAKGQLLPGFDADLVLVDADAEWMVTDEAMASKCGWTPYAGRTLMGRVIHTFVQGGWAVRESELQHGPSGRPVIFQVM
ncbi:MAG: dihydroorotase [Fimbriimonadaceae bacterium]|nr:dihydroorotase [Fimbriimonadaceae bacterium]